MQNRLSVKARIDENTNAKEAAGGPAGGTSCLLCSLCCASTVLWSPALCLSIAFLCSLGTTCRLPHLPQSLPLHSVLTLQDEGLPLFPGQLSLLQPSKKFSRLAHACTSYKSLPDSHLSCPLGEKFSHTRYRLQGKCHFGLIKVFPYTILVRLATVPVRQPCAAP